MGIRLAPLDEGIIEAIRQDDERLRDTGTDVKVVQVFNLSGLPPGDVAVPGLTPTSGATPVAGETPTPGAILLAGGTPTPTPTPLPYSTPTPTPTPTPASTPGPTPTPSVTPGCSPPDTQSGFVQTVTPSNGATGVPVSTNIVIRFNQPMNVTSVNTTNVYLMDSSKRPGGLWVTVSYNSNTYEATMNPNGNLNPGAIYYPAVWKGIRTPAAPGKV